MISWSCGRAPGRPYTGHGQRWSRARLSHLRGPADPWSGAVCRVSTAAWGRKIRHSGCNRCGTGSCAELPFSGGEFRPGDRKVGHRFGGGGHIIDDGAVDRQSDDGSERGHPVIRVGVYGGRMQSVIAREGEIIFAFFNGGAEFFGFGGQGSEPVGLVAAEVADLGEAGFTVGQERERSGGGGQLSQISDLAAAGDHG